MRRLSLLLVLIVLASAGCARGIGAKRLPIDRTAYVEALGNSWKDQVLYNIVHIRYNEPQAYLDVSSIAQSYQILAGIDELSYSFSSGGKDAESLWNVPGHTMAAKLKGTYQTSPTITYQPISGEALKASLLEPIPKEDICKGLETGWDPKIIFPYTIQSVNNLRNRPGGNPEFFDLVATWQRLWRNGGLVISFEEVTKAEAPTLDGKNGTSKSQPDKWGESAASLAKFTSKLVKEQAKQCEEKTIAPFVILKRTRACANDMDTLKKYLGLVDNPAEKLKERCGKLFASQPFNENAMKLLKEMGLSDEKIKNNKDKIWEFLGFPTGLTSQEQDKLRAEIKGKSLYKEGNPPIEEEEYKIEKYQVVSGVPPEEKNLSKIYLRTRSIAQVLALLSEFVEVPLSDEHKVQPKNRGWKDWFKDKKMPQINIMSVGGGAKPELWDKPKEFAAVKYKGNWFYIRDEDPDSKDVLSSMIGIFTMMPTGKKETPVLTLPVR